MLAGPKGVGKASLAYRFARVALGAKRVGPRPLDVSPEDVISRRIAGRAHPDWFILRRALNDTGKPKRDIAVDDARELSAFFTLAPSEGGMRVAIIDAVDDLNKNSANAILKTLEEPPARCALLLVCHAPGAALATIRSRCRRLPMRRLSDVETRKAAGDDTSDALVRLANGRPGRAIALKAQGLNAGGAEFERLLEALARGEALRAAPKLYEQLSGEPFERLAGVIELAEECARSHGANLDAPMGQVGAWAEAWSALEGLRVEAEDMDMDPRLALGRVAAILDRAATQRR
jgi:DNA polymerase-3 subunit delta'